MKENLDYLLFSGKEIKLDCGLSIKQHLISDINDKSGIGYKRYESVIWSLTRYPYEFKFDLDDANVDYSNLNTYDIFIMLISKMDYRDAITDLNYLFNDKFEIVDNHFKSDKGIIDEVSIEEIKKVLSKILFLRKPIERKPANEEAKKLIKKQIKINQNKKVQYDIYSIMYGLVASANSSETYETILNRTPHQIYASYLHTQKHKDFDNTMSGIYSGVINSKDVNLEKINWVNKID